MLIRRFDQALFFSRMSDMICAIYKAAATTATKGKEKSIPKMFELMYSTTKWHHQHQRACLCLSHYIFCCVSIQRDTAREEETRWYYCEMIFLASSFNQTQTIFFLFGFSLSSRISCSQQSQALHSSTESAPHYYIVVQKKAQRVKLPSNPTDNNNNCTQHRGMKSSIFFLSLQYMSAAAKQHRAGEIDNSGSMCLWKSYWGKIIMWAGKTFSLTDFLYTLCRYISFIQRHRLTRCCVSSTAKLPIIFHTYFLFLQLVWSCFALPPHWVYQSQLNLIKL